MSFSDTSGLRVKNTFFDVFDDDVHHDDRRTASWPPLKRQQEGKKIQQAKSVQSKSHASVPMSSKAPVAESAASTDDGEISKSGSGSIQQTPPQTPKEKKARTNTPWDGQQDDDNTKDCGPATRACERCGQGVPTDSETLKIATNGKKFKPNTKLDARGVKYYCRCILTEHWVDHPDSCKPCIDWHSKGHCRKELACKHCHLDHDMQMKEPRLHKKERQMVETLKEQLDTSKKQVETLKEQLETSKKQVETLKEQLETSKKQVSTLKKQVETLKAELQAAREAALQETEFQALKTNVKELAAEIVREPKTAAPEYAEDEEALKAALKAALERITALKVSPLVTQNEMLQNEVQKLNQENAALKKKMQNFEAARAAADPK